jgi:hypothetical protein
MAGRIRALPALSTSQIRGTAAQGVGAEVMDIQQVVVSKAWIQLPLEL